MNLFQFLSYLILAGIRAVFPHRGGERRGVDARLAVVEGGGFWGGGAGLGGRLSLTLRRGAQRVDDLARRTAHKPYRHHDGEESLQDMAVLASTKWMGSSWRNACWLDAAHNPFGTIPLSILPRPVSQGLACVVRRPQRRRACLIGACARSHGGLEGTRGSICACLRLNSLHSTETGRRLSGLLR